MYDSLIIDVAVKSTLWLLAFIILVKASHRLAAPARRAMWLVAFVGLAALPLSSWVAKSRAPGLVRLSVASVPTQTTPFEKSTSSEAVSTRAGDVPPAHKAGARTAPSPVSTLWLLWAAGAILFSTRQTLRWVRGAITCRRATPIMDATWRRAARGVGRSMGVAMPRLCASSETEIPFVAGLTRATIVLPADYERWPAARRHAVLVHEFAHLRQRDPIARLFIQLVTVAYWAHPLVYHASAGFESACESSCDDAVVRAGVAPSVYARELIHFSRRIGAAHGIAMAKRKTLPERIRFILDPTVPRKTPSRRVRTTIACTATLVFVATATFQVVASERRPSPDVVKSAMDTNNAMTRQPLIDLSAADTHDEMERRVRRDAVALLDDTDPRVRLAAVHELGDRRDPRTVADLIPLLNDPVHSVRDKAAWALGEIGDAAAVDALMAVAANGDDAVSLRRQAVRGLGEIGDPSAVPLLLDLLADGPWRLRSQAADALGDIGAEQARPALQRALRDGSRHVRDNARKALRKIP